MSVDTERSVVILLDIIAAFGTTDHDIVLDRLRRPSSIIIWRLHFIQKRLLSKATYDFKWHKLTLEQHVIKNSKCIPSSQRRYRIFSAAVQAPKGLVGNEVQVSARVHPTTARSYICRFPLLPLCVVSPRDRFWVQSSSQCTHSP